MTRAGYTVGVFVLLSPAQCDADFCTRYSEQATASAVAGGFHMSFETRKAFNC